jgi:MFS family permease
MRAHAPAGFPGFGADGPDPAAWTGVLVSSFFLTQFATSLPWATVADKYGQRTVLFVSLLGSAFACACFGFARTLPQAMAVRLLQGVFAGAIGVARGGVVCVTDASNEGRAYAILGYPLPPFSAKHDSG